MSENKLEELKLITLDPEEFNSIVRRVHTMLVKRADRAKARKDACSTKRSASRYIEASKDLFVFVHMIELIDHMSGEIGELRETISMLGVDEDDAPQMFAGSRTNLPN